jgi:peptidoglycan hydrolase-like protein with peptidoglycan-binding domain
MRFRAFAAACAVAAVLCVIPASALAAPSATTPVKAAAHLALSGLVSVHKDGVTVPGRDVKVTGTVRPYVAGQRVLVQAFVGTRRFAQRLMTLRPAAHGTSATFSTSFAAPAAGDVAIRVKHSRDAKMLSFVSVRRYQVLSESVTPGSTGRFVQLLQSRLAALHLYVPQTGVFDNGTELALDAYHRLLGWGEGDESVNPATVTDLLDGKGSFHVRFPSQGLHAEGDLSIQVLAYIRGDKVFELLPISSGKPSTPTILGSYQVYRKQPGYTSDGMYYSNFFTGGYAIHGYDPAPDYPASHGCMRIPIVDAIFAYGLIGVGDWVDTYYT